MTSEHIDHRHPITKWTDDLHHELEKLTTAPLPPMSPEQVRQALTLMARLETEVTALQLQILAEIQRSGAIDGR